MNEGYTPCPPYSTANGLGTLQSMRLTAYSPEIYQAPTGNNNDGGSIHPFEVHPYASAAQLGSTRATLALSAPLDGQTFNSLNLASFPNTYGMNLGYQQAALPVGINQHIPGDATGGFVEETFALDPGSGVSAFHQQSFGGYNPVAASCILPSQSHGKSSKCSSQNQRSQPTDGISARDVWTLRGASEQLVS
jgi:hypothetical protein